MKKINKVYFLIHPVCWASSLIDGKAPLNAREVEFMAIYGRERTVRKKQDEFIARMKEDELLILYPIGQTPEMLKLEEYAAGVLEDRCIILRREPANLSSLQGYLPDDIMLDLSKEILDFSAKIKYNFNSGCIKVLYTSRGYAFDLKKEFNKRGFGIDPETVYSEAFGEGFEQCAMTWKGMVGHYLGWRNPTENNYDLSVSGAHFLIKARFVEKLNVKDDIRLFLWEGSYGNPIGMFARSCFKLGDPRYYVGIAGHLDSFDIASLNGAAGWPSENRPDNPVHVNAQSFTIPVYEASRRYFNDDALYIIGRDISMIELKKLLLSSIISETC